MAKSPSRSGEQERDLHRRLISGDPVASVDLAIEHLGPLVDWLQQSNPRMDPHCCAEAADEAILALIRDPASYQPDKMRLEAYLRMSSQGDLLNLIRKEQRHHEHRKSWSLVELDDSYGKYLGVEDPPVVEPADQAVEEVDGEVERRVFELMKDGERRTSEYAKVCNVTHLPMREQRREVKRVKDRLKTRLKRARREK